MKHKFHSFSIQNTVLNSSLPLRIISLVLFYTLYSFSLYAGGSLEITNVESPATAGYSNETFSQTYTVTTNFTAGYFEPNANSYLTFSSGSSGSFEPYRKQEKEVGVTLDYQLYNNLMDKFILKDFSANPTSNNVLSHYFSGSSEYIHEYSLEIPENQYSIGGTYTDTITLNLYSRSMQNPRLRDSDSVTFTTIVPIELDIAVVNPGGSFTFSDPDYTLDFGFLSEGEQMGFDVIVQANTYYNIEVQSEQGGALEPVSLTGDPSKIDYTLTFNTTDYTLGTSKVVLHENGIPTNPEVNPADGRFPVTITIDPFDWPTSGDYQDILTFTIQAN